MEEEFMSRPGEKGTLDESEIKSWATAPYPHVLGGKKVTGDNRVYVPQAYGSLARAGGSAGYLYLCTTGVASCVGLALSFNAGGQRWGFLAHVDEKSLPAESVQAEFVQLRAFIQDVTKASSAELAAARVALVQAGGMGDGDGGLLAAVIAAVPLIGIETAPVLEKWDSIALSLDTGKVMPYHENKIKYGVTDSARAEEKLGMPREDVNVTFGRDQYTLNHDETIMSCYMGHGACMPLLEGFPPNPPLGTNPEVVKVEFDEARARDAVAFLRVRDEAPRFSGGLMGSLSDGSAVSVLADHGDAAPDGGAAGASTSHR